MDELFLQVFKDKYIFSRIKYYLRFGDEQCHCQKAYFEHSIEDIHDHCSKSKWAVILDDRMQMHSRYRRPLEDEKSLESHLFFSAQDVVALLRMSVPYSVFKYFFTEYRHQFDQVYKMKRLSEFEDIMALVRTEDFQITKEIIDTYECDLSHHFPFSSLELLEYLFQKDTAYKIATVKAFERNFSMTSSFGVGPVINLPHQSIYLFLIKYYRSHSLVIYENLSLAFLNFLFTYGYLDTIKDLFNNPSPPKFPYAFWEHFNRSYRNDSLQVTRARFECIIWLYDNGHMDRGFCYSPCELIGHSMIEELDLLEKRFGKYPFGITDHFHNSYPHYIFDLSNLTCESFKRISTMLYEHHQYWNIYWTEQMLHSEDLELIDLVMQNQIKYRCTFPVSSHRLPVLKHLVKFYRRNIEAIKASYVMADIEEYVDYLLHLRDFEGLTIDFSEIRTSNFYNLKRFQMITKIFNQPISEQIANFSLMYQYGNIVKRGYISALGYLIDTYFRKEGFNYVFHVDNFGEMVKRNWIDLAQLLSSAVAPGKLLAGHPSFVESHLQYFSGEMFELLADPSLYDSVKSVKTLLKLSIQKNNLAMVKWVCSHWRKEGHQDLIKIEYATFFDIVKLNHKRVFLYLVVVNAFDPSLFLRVKMDESTYPYITTFLTYQPRPARKTLLTHLLKQCKRKSEFHFFEKLVNQFKSDITFQFKDDLPDLFKELEIKDIDTWLSSNEEVCVIDRMVSFKFNKLKE